MGISAADLIVDFSREVRSSGTHVEAGWTPAVIGKFRIVQGKEAKRIGLSLPLKLTAHRRTIFETLWLTERALGRYRDLLEACGRKVPGKVDIRRIGKAVENCSIYVLLEDDVKEGYATRSRVAFNGFAHPDEVPSDDTEGDDDFDMDESADPDDDLGDSDDDDEFDLSEFE